MKKPRLCSVLLQSTQEAVDHERSVGENTRRSLLLECSIASQVLYNKTEHSRRFVICFLIKNPMISPRIR